MADLERINALQGEIFQRHMAFEVNFPQPQREEGSKDFCDKFAALFEAKQEELLGIVRQPVEKFLSTAEHTRVYKRTKAPRCTAIRAWMLMDAHGRSVASRS